MNLLTLLPARDWLYICAFLVLLGGGVGFVRHEREIGAARVEQIMKAQTEQREAVAAAWAASAVSETQRRQMAQKESDHEADKFQALADAGHADAVSALAGLRERAAASTSCLPSNSSAVAAGSAASAAADLPADVLGRLGQAAVDIAAFADAAYGHGANAERQYDSLNLPRGLSPAGD